MVYSGTGDDAVWLYKRLPAGAKEEKYVLFQRGVVIGKAATIQHAMQMMRGRVWSDDKKTEAQNKRRAR
jgi:hypothetical protein